jgi:hypothetical protein
MIRTYETFGELADAMVQGEGLLHLFNCSKHDGITDPCIAWQKGVTSFAKWLDHIGVKVNIPDGAEDFYTFSTRRRDK